jgi:hypothetical protein
MLTLAQIKVFLAITGTADDAILNACIADAKGEADRATNRKLAYAERTVYLQGNGSNSLQLGQWPIAAVTTLQYFDGTNWIDIVVSPDTITDSILILNAGRIEFIKPYWFPCSRIKVVFNAGYLWGDAWAATTTYAVDDYVIYNNTLYKCITAHTSGATFTAANFEAQTVEAVPADLEKAIKYNAAVIYYDSPAGQGWFMKGSANTGGQSSEGYTIRRDEMIKYYEKTYSAYRKVNI